MPNDIFSRIVKRLGVLRFGKPAKPHSQSIAPPDVCIVNANTPKGRAAFANRHFEKGELVERCPVLIIDEPHGELPEQLRPIAFDWSTAEGVASAIALGFGAFYNQEGSPNMRCQIDVAQPALVFTTIRSVRKGEALTVNDDAMGGYSNWNSNEWLKNKSISVRLEPPEVCVKDTGGAKGLGVFASRDFLQGEIINECPVILFKVPFSPPGELRRRVFSWLALVKNSGPYAYALALGFGSLYNHDDLANMRYEANTESLTLKFTAARNIHAGEELTINYNAPDGVGSSDDRDWFERMNVRRADS